MMPSVIPARLQFQCGHAALVTLPRVKGETATQRNDRVAREKTAALARQCDFCAPSVAVLEPQVAAVNGNHGEFAPSDVLEPTPVAELSVLVSDESETPSPAEQTLPEVDVETVISPAEPLDADVVEPEQGAVEVPEEVVAEAIIALHTEEAPAAKAEAEERPARKPRRPRRQAAGRQPARRQRTRRQPAPAPAPAAAPTLAAAQPATVAPTRARRAPARRAPATRVPTVSTQRFVVEFQVERVLRASDVRDVLRQLTAQGAADVLSVTRED
jgi:hypothetical protein